MPAGNHSINVDTEPQQLGFSRVTYTGFFKQKRSKHIAVVEHNDFSKVPQASVTYVITGEKSEFYSSFVEDFAKNEVV